MASDNGRQVIVDDMDPNIQYKGNWNLRSAGAEPFSNYNLPYNKTLHQTDKRGKISYTFNGTSVSVMGAIAGTDIGMRRRASSQPLKCFINGIHFPNSGYLRQNNGWVLCEQHNIPDGKHELKVHFNSSGVFDNILYTPSLGLSFETANMLVDNSDPGIIFSSNWTYPNRTVPRLTWAPNSTATFNFTGTGVSWFGSKRRDLSQNPANASYVVDGGPPTVFNLPYYTYTNFSHELFTIPNLQPKPHTLVVTFEGNENTVPLTLDYLVVANTSTPFSVEKHRPPVGGIVGGVTGGLFFVVAFVLSVFWWYRRRRRGTSEESGETTEIEPPPSYTTRAPGVSSYPTHLFAHSNPNRLSLASNTSRLSLALSGYTPDTVAQTRALRKCQETGLHPVRPPSLPYPEDKEDINGDDVIRTKSPTQLEAENGEK